MSSVPTAITSIEKCALKESHLYLKPDGFSGKYGCMVVFEDNNQKNELRYKLDITFIERSNEINTVYSIDRDDEVFINDRAPENFIDQLAFEASTFMYPLLVTTNYEGKIFDIANFEAVKNRWRKHQKELKEKYKGKLVDLYLKRMDEALQSKNIFEQKILKDWFLYLYFAPLYTSYSDDYFVYKKITYPIVNKITPVSYDVEQKIEKHKKGFRVKINGEIQDDRCAKDIEQFLNTPYHNIINPGEKDLKGECEIQYLINDVSGIVEGYDAKFRTSFRVEKKINVRMFLLEHLQNKNQSLDAEEENKTKSKKGFFSRLFSS
ncbi:hypothetical protein ATE84_2811 [Aquimarina sp. MAR_2010_214]|uniref:hypothetical protein n=1 Tax=Aquimarina sp. MAR_2010_214 TaxID=1250026 RepID=UPI000C709A15|nr:hypothetical protein [Aquimarina sp. MAR_2010_214]PKV50745.1 hypothetical protein ATE84_2811 [Aquimarina sp. MAR_2010_214]